MDWKRRLVKRTGISYCRKSTKPRGVDNEVDGIYYQEKTIREYCEFDNIEIIRCFNDIGYTGRHHFRPELIEMLEYLENDENKIDVMLFYTVDRLGRDLMGNLDVMLKIGKLVGEIVFVSEGMTNSSDYFVRYIIQSSVQAQNERITITKKLTDGKQKKAGDRGIYIGSDKPLGYIRQKEDGKLVLATLKNTKDLMDHQGYEVVQFIFWGYLSNLSLRQIASALHTQFGLTKKGVKWCHKSVKYILENSIYAGIMQGDIGGKKHYNSDALVEPLLTKSMHTIVKERLSREKSGRKSKWDSIPILSLTICFNCLKSVRFDKKENKIICSACKKGMDFDFYMTAVNQTLTNFMYTKYSNQLQKLLEQKKVSLYMQIYALKNELNELKGRRKLIHELFYNDKRTLDRMLEENFNHRIELLEVLNDRVYILDYLYDSNDIDLGDIMKTSSDTSQLIKIPFLALLDGEKEKVYIKFHDEVFNHAGN